jgi:hypothetical protein
MTRREPVATTYLRDGTFDSEEEVINYFEKVLDTYVI